MSDLWNWYERHLILNISIALSLLLLQIIHPYRLDSYIIYKRLTGHNYFELSGV